jgi:S-adenosyl-L-methionine hydrolase (adenosine-forming)
MQVMSKQSGGAISIALILIVAGLTACSPSKKAPAPVEPLIALLTDYGQDDAFVAEMKGAILTVNPRVRLIDLTHEVEPFNQTQAAYLLSQSAKEFPAGTIFVAVVDPGVGTARNPIMVQTKAGKYYIAANNGILTLVLEREPVVKAWKLDRPGYYRQGTLSTTDHGRDIFGPVAAYLASGVPADSIGSTLPEKEIVQLSYHPGTINGRNMSGEILHIDHYGNIVTNIPASIAGGELKEGILLRVNAGNKTFAAPLVKTFADVQKGRVAIIVGSQGLLEIVANQASAAKATGIQAGVPVLVQLP